MGVSVLVRVDGVDDGFPGEEIRHQGGVLRLHGEGPGGFPLVQVLRQVVEEGRLMGVFLVALHGLDGLFLPAAGGFQVRHSQFQVDDVDVPRRVRPALHVDDVLVVEAADHVDNGVRLPDVGQELVPQALAPAGPLHQTRDVHELHHRRGLFLRLVQFRQVVQPGVRHRHHAHVGVDGAEGVVGALCPGVGDGVEKRGFPHVWQSHNPQFHP